MAGAHAIFVEEFPAGAGDGLTVAVKDTIDIAGHPTRAGSRLFADAAPAERNADVVQSLLDAGCRIVGKTNLHELAYGVTGINEWTGTPVNPNYPGRVPGGSSSGSAAAVAARLVDFALGTDTGGSIRVPAACCGIVGFKPTFGRVSRKGALPATSGLDCIGPLAVDVATIERAMEIIAPGFRPEPLPLRPSLGVVAVDADPAIRAAFGAALESLDCELVPVALESFDAAFDAGLTVIAAEAWAAFGAHADSPRIGADVRSRLLARGEPDRSALADAEAVRVCFTGEVDHMLAGVDALVLPTMPIYPPTIEQARAAHGAVNLTAFVRPFNLSGHPALTVPLESDVGLPLGIQLVGRRGEDASLCAVGRWMEACLADSDGRRIKQQDATLMSAGRCPC